MVDQPLLVEELNTFAGKLVHDYAVSDALHDLVEAIAAILGIHGAGVSLAQDEGLRFATSVPHDVADVERAQERAQIGPCVEAYRSGAAVFADLLTEPARWPELTSAAESAGIVAVAGIPMHLDGARIGAVDLYDVEPHAWTQEETRIAELLAALATGYIVNASRLDQARHTAAQLQEALDSRVVIEQAKGILAGERDISIDQAFHVIRGHARNHGAPLRSIAEAVVKLGLRP